MLKLPLLLFGGLAALVVVPLFLAMAGALVGVVTGVGVGIGVPLFVGLGVLVVLLVKFAGPILLVVGIIWLLKNS
jgi:hypothetical protein